MYELIRSNRKTLQLEVKTDGRVIVRAPYFCSKKKIEEFVESRRAWIENTRSRIEKQQEHAGAVQKLSEDELKELIRKAEINSLG